MKNFVKEGDVVTATPATAVTGGAGYLAGSFFGVAVVDVAAGASGEFVAEGIVELPKAAVAVAFGDRIFWDTANKVVTNVGAGKQCVGVAVADAAVGASVAQVRLGAVTAVGA